MPYGPKNTVAIFHSSWWCKGKLNIDGTNVEKILSLF